MNKYIPYLAGIIDGEGSINITYIKKRDEYRLRIQVTNTDKRLIDWLSEHFGGHQYEPVRLNNNSKWRRRYEWFLYPKKETIPLLETLIPFLICKKEQAKVAIRFMQTIGTMGHRLTRAVYKTRKECKERLNALNKRGTSEQRLSEKGSKEYATV